MHATSIKTQLLAMMLAPLLIAAAVPVLAQGQQSPQSGNSARDAQNAVRMNVPAGGRDMRASEVIGKQVKNPQGENLGDIEDLVIDIDNQRVSYVVLSFGGIANIGDKQFALPAGRLQPGERERDPLVLNASKEELEKAPGFSPDKRPNFSEETYRGAVDRYFFKEETARHTPSGARLISAEQLIGKDVNDRAAHSAGEIEDLVVNFGTGRAYAVLEVDKALSPKDKLVALPLKAFSFPQRPDLDLLLNVDRPLIENARGLGKDEWADVNAAAARRQIDSELARFQGQVKSNPGATQTGRESSSGASR
ncbi:MAG TPA: PRC-barrel domain-containing protein [Noviherbaspirillum sp.]|jgi:sporulation protein YlmC with PRC-barrel domain|uniref:PRC-barrel domain-containing protein n=1 Tax=Noviherbaspirillum sp. TaxID=1926288 RepID=UPI002F93AA24